MHTLLTRLGLAGLMLALWIGPVQAQIVGGGGAAGSAATEYAEDSPHTSTDSGTMPLTVRSDAGGSLCGADGDYCPFQVDSNGALRVTGGGGGTEYNTNDPAPANPVGTSTLMERDDALSALTEIEGDWTNMRANANGALWTIDANSAAILTALQLIDNVVFAEDAAHVSSDAGIPSLCVRHDTATTGLGLDGDYANCGISAAGRIYVDALISDGAGALNVIVDSGTVTAVTSITNPVTITDGAGALNVIVDSGTVTAVTAITNALPVGANVIGQVSIDQTTPGTTNLVQVTDGAGALNVIVDSGTLTTVSTVTTVSAVTAITNALPAGTNAIGKLAANSGVDIGDVDVTSVIPGTGATNQGKAVDSIAGATDTGIAILAIRDDALTTLTPIDGDYVQLRVNSTGALHVTGGGGGTEYTIGDAAPTIGSMALVIRDDALTTLADADGDAVAMRVDSVGSLHVTIDSIAATASSASVTEDGSIPADATGVTEVAAVLYCDDGTNPVHCAYTTAGGLNTSVAAVIPGTGATNLGKAVDSVAGATDTGVAILAVRDDALGALTPIEGDYVHLRVNSTGALHVTGGGGGTQYNIDDAGGATDTGTVLLAIRDDALTTLTPVDGDYVGLRVSSTGALHVTGGGGGTEYVVNAVAPADPTGATFTMERDDALGTLTEIEGDWTNPRATAEGALWTQDFNSDTMLAHLATLAGAVGGTEVQVDVVSGSITANAGTNLNTSALLTATNFSDAFGTAGTADSQVMSVQGIASMTPLLANPGTAANWGVYVEDDAETAGGNLMMTGTVRRDVAASSAGITGDNATLNTTALGKLWTTGAFLEDAAHTTGDIGLYVMGRRIDTAAASSGTSGDYESFNMDASGRLWVNPGVIGIEDAAETAAGNLSMVGTVRRDTAASSAGTTGDNATLNTDASGRLWAIITGDVAHDGVDSGNPVKIGGRAVAHGSNPTGVAAADRTDLLTNRAGIPFTIGGHPNSITISAQVQDADGALSDQAMVSVAGGSKIVVTRLTASCDGSTTAPTNIKVGFGATTLAASAHTGVAGILHEFDGTPAGGGLTIGDGSGILGIGADGEDLRYTIEDPTGGNCTISATYFTIES